MTASYCCWHHLREHTLLLELTGSPFGDDLLFLERCATSSPLSFSLLNCNLDIIIIQPELLTIATSSIVHSFKWLLDRKSATSEDRER